uniref:NADH-ubiquinone oxidoreductase chain 2 n=1 Tax=Songmachilis xinxiangensis TaxID=1224734 RepID=R4IKI7_9INSE|nr:NADH dehydrogenase subunit 2 [Songmachilis xinxiangensis]AFQ07901.1 NADH dehydrogenase subunit 2 [Songmachilis xinxiangensis]
MFNPTNILFSFILLSSTLISVSSTSWFGAWMGLEINLLSFIPLLNNGMNQRSSEASLKYFLMQAFGSVTLICGAIMFYYLPNSPIFFSEKLSIYLISSALLLKMGAAPFHFWFPMVMEGISWKNGIILMTWQKLSPLMLLSYNMLESKFLVMFSIIMSAFVGAVGGLNQTFLRKIMSFSSINHMSWIMAAMMWSESTWMFYYMMYVILSSSISLIFLYFNIFHITQIYEIFKTSMIKKLMLSFNFLSLGGLPPFSGFLPKWIVIQDLIFNKMTIIVVIMIFSALLTLFYYSRIIYLMFTMSSSTKMWQFTPHLNHFLVNFSILILSYASIFLIPVLIACIPLM